MEVLLPVGIVLLVVAVAWWTWHRAKKRREALLAFAVQHGLQFSRRDPFGMLGYPFALFSRGDGRGIENVVSGAWQGLAVKLADYWYYTESTDSEGKTSRTYHRFSIAVAELALAAPAVEISRENVMTRLGGKLGWKDIDFESEAFNRRFHVVAKDREFAFKLVDARLMHWLLEQPHKFGFEVVGPWLLVYGAPRKPTELVPLLGTARAFRDRIPRIIWNEYGTDGQPQGAARIEANETERSGS